MRQWDSGHTNAVCAVVKTLAFSPDGRALASGNAVGEVKLWDVYSGQELMTLKASTAIVEYLTFSPDGTKLAVSCNDHDSVSLDLFVWYAPRTP